MQAAGILIGGQIYMFFVALLFDTVQVINFSLLFSRHAEKTPSSIFFFLVQKVDPELLEVARAQVTPQAPAPPVTTTTAAAIATTTATATATASSSSSALPRAAVEAEAGGGSGGGADGPLLAPLLELGFRSVEVRAFKTGSVSRPLRA
jgi:hypothetical protein